MPAILLFFFVAIPLIEIFVIIQVGQLIGAWWTIGLLLADSVVGAWLLRREGAKAWRAFREALAEGRWPGDEVAQGAMVIVGGTLLLTPGFVTDVVGFLLLVPGSRRMAARTVRSRMKEQMTGGAVGGSSKRRSSRRPGSASGSGVLDVEVVEIRRDDDGGASDVQSEDEGPDPDASGELGGGPARD